VSTETDRKGLHLIENLKYHRSPSDQKPEEKRDILNINLFDSDYISKYKKIFVKLITAYFFQNCIVNLDFFHFTTFCTCFENWYSIVCKSLKDSIGCVWVTINK
jgi:hypothetical protein